MPVLFVYTERGEGKTRVPFTSKISNQIAIYLNCTVNGNDFFFCFTNPRLAGQRAIGARCILAGEKGKPLIINSPFCPCFTTCKDSKRINFGRACKIAIPGIHHRMSQWTPSPTVFPAFSHFYFIVSAKELRPFETNQTCKCDTPDP